MALVYVSLGSNLGEREEYLAQARKAIEKSFNFPRFSKIYETEPVDLKDQPWFLNQVAEFQTDLAPETLLEWAWALEAQAGRRREVPKGPRTLDVDILLYDDWVLDVEELVLPHPRLEQRRHVLVPLCELAPGRCLPVSQKTVLEALEQVTDKGQVKPHAST
ncbi:MAG TPA: 2-amino-4-hydroxy-6-hydroxymethyldihydropteridine diphosphokinase [bacterium]|nr:2-amino-4-hydroxy-6-hydroxymethyldihydropteridine diphosphokinase [bacterium]